jgi:signal transduction histidine kinase/CheY-like chemotaxis protein/HPt (histidine-containing phosphotransfer) domain-containing protein
MRGSSVGNAERRAVLGFGISTLLLVVLGAALYVTSEQARVSASLADRSLQVLDHLARLEAAVSRSQAAQRGAGLFGAERFVAERDAALDDAGAQVERLSQLALSGAGPRSEVDELRTLLERRARRMRSVLESWRAGAKPELPQPANGLDKPYSERIGAITERLRDAQLAALRAHRQSEETQFRVMYALLAASALLFFAVIVPIYVAFVRQARSRRNAESRVVELTESLPGAVFQARRWPDGRINYEFLSSSAQAVRGIDVDAALADASAVIETIHPDDRKAFHESIAWAASRLRPLDLDYRILHPQKGTRWIRAVSSPSRQADGSVRWSGHWADITTQKEMEAGLLRAMEEAGAANQAKSRFLATVSHEIRTPMNGVLAMLELLSLTRLDDEQAASLAVVRESGQALLRIIDDILDFSKIEAGKLDIVPQPASIARIVERVVNIYSGVASARGLALTTFVDPAIAPAHFLDPVRVQQILGNLVNNAVKFTQQGGVELAVRLVAKHADEEVVRFEVKDSGIGMTPDEQSRVFEAFSQASAETAGRFGGTGLGLAISRQLARLMNGTIEMRSRAGVGTELRVTLPMKSAPVESISAQAMPPLPAAALARRTPPQVDVAARAGSLVLVVDDHPINRLVLQKQVNALGYACETAENGAEALEKWRRGRYALLLLDCNMPEVSGYDVCRAIRAGESEEAQRARTPVIACTANALVGESDKCAEAGMDDYLVKPVALGELAAKLARWIGAAPFELATLEEISGGDPLLAREMLERFQRYNEDDSHRLREAWRARSLADIVAACHRIKGAGKTIGALALASACERAEHSARAADWAGVEAGIQEFERELERVERYIASAKEAA